MVAPSGKMAYTPTWVRAINPLPAHRRAFGNASALRGRNVSPRATSTNAATNSHQVILTSWLVRYCSSNPTIRFSIATRRASSWRRWSPGRYPKLRTNHQRIGQSLPYGRGSDQDRYHSDPSRDRKGAIGLLALSLVLLSACRQDMHDQPKYIPLRPSDFFADGRSARPITEGTVARGHLNDDTLFYTGKGADGKPSNEFPMPVTKELILRGEQRFNVYCTPCHDRTGNGNGMIVRRGYRHPPTYHSDRLRQQPNGYIFDVITNGFGAMPDYAAQVPVPDRWAIVAYIRALQLSQQASINDVPPAARGRLEDAARG